MILLRNFNRRATVIRLEQFGAPKIAPFSELELPRGSILHYIPTSGVSEIGPPQTLPMLNNADKLVQVNHNTTLTDNNILGRPRKIEKPINREVMQYHRVNKKLRRLHTETLVERDDKTLLVENYAPIQMLYRYPQTIMAWYERFVNLLNTAVERIGRDADKYERQNYLLLDVPEKLPARTKLRRAEKRRDNVSLEDLRDPTALMFLELWTWLGENREHAIFNGFTQTQLRRINIIMHFSGKFVNLNLGELDYWRAGDTPGGKVSPDQMQKRLYKTVISLAQAAMDDPVGETVEEDTAKDLSGEEVMELVDRSDAFDSNEDIDVSDEIKRFEEQEDTISDDDDFEIIKQEDKDTDAVVIDSPTSIDSGIEKVCEAYIEAGTLSSKEYTRVLDRAQTYKQLDNPFGEGKLTDMLTVAPEELALEEEVMTDDFTQVDKALTKTKTKQFTRRYVEQVLPKDIAGAVVSVQKAGIAVTDYKVENVVDAANGLQLHSVKVEPVKGRPSTIHFTTPLLDEQGYWTANDVTYTMRKQRVDQKSYVM